MKRGMVTGPARSDLARSCDEAWEAALMRVSLVLDAAHDDLA